jgi:hypothetical protein
MDQLCVTIGKPDQNYKMSACKNGLAFRSQIPAKINHLNTGLVQYLDTVFEWLGTAYTMFYEWKFL